MHSLLHHIQNLRVIKSPSEIKLLKKAGEIAVNAFKQVNVLLSMLDTSLTRRLYVSLSLLCRQYLKHGQICTSIN